MPSMAHEVLVDLFKNRPSLVSDAARERILTEKDPDRLERWIERAIIAPSLADVLDEPS
jgi:hypothetical protein